MNRFFSRLWLLLFAVLFVSVCCEELKDDDDESPPSGAVDNLDDGIDGPDAASGAVDDGSELEEGGDEGDEEGDGDEDSEEDDLDENSPEVDQDEEAEEEEDGSLDPLTSEQIAALFKKMDTNGNGKVSLAEVNDYATSMRRAIAKMELDDIIAKKDTNKDGSLTFEEFLGDPTRVSEKMQNEQMVTFKEMDKNGDKVVSADELAAEYHHHTNEKVEKMLTEIAMKDKDTNNDGKLSLEEFYAHLTGGDDENDEEEAAAVGISDDEKEEFKKLDIDNDGSLSLAELQAWESGSFQAEEAVKKLFLHADKDEDSQITGKELEDAREEIASFPDGDAHMYLSIWHDVHNERGEL